jgi:hypothetical protein
MLSEAIEAIEKEIASLKDRVAMEIKGINAYLSRPGAKTKLRPWIVEHRGYSTFSIVWQRLVYYDFANRRAKLKAIRKGPSYRVPRSRLFSHCVNCSSWETEYIWEKEEKFGRVRRKSSLLSQALSAVKKCNTLEPETTTEQSGCALSPVIPCLRPQEVVKTLVDALGTLKERTLQEVAEVTSHLSEHGRTSLRPRVGSGNGIRAFTVEWVKSGSKDPKTDERVEREISREGRRSVRRSRLLAHCRDSEELEQEYIWEKEVGFGRVRRQAELLVQATTALKQYIKEAKEK